MVAFNSAFYLAENSDVAAAVAAGTVPSAESHFNAFGQFEGRDPNAQFDTDFYLANNQDVATAFQAGLVTSAFQHFEDFGVNEGRVSLDGFDAATYLAANPDVQSAVTAGSTNAFAHYVNFGVNEGRTGAPLFGDENANTLNGSAGDDIINGLGGVDTINGGGGDDVIFGGTGQDNLTGGAGSDTFSYDGDAFNGTDVSAAGRQGVNLPDAITDFSIADDVLSVNSSDFGITAPLSFANGLAANLAGDANVIVLQDSFTSAGAAAAAIAANDALVADEGLFIYFNSNLNINRLVFSNDLGDNGDFSVLAGLENITGADALAALPTFTASNFNFDENDVIVGTNAGETLVGLAGNDTINGLGGNDLLAGGSGVDTLTGGLGEDRFRFDGDAFNGVDVSAPGRQGVNTPDVITDFSLSDDIFSIDTASTAFGIDAPLSFANGLVNNLSGNANVIVLQDSFTSAGAAAAAIAANDALTADQGLFVYFNSNLGINRLVFSNDLGDNGDFSVIAALNNVTGDDALAALPIFAASNFEFI